MTGQGVFGEGGDTSGAVAEHSSWERSTCLGTGCCFGGQVTLSATFPGASPELELLPAGVDLLRRFLPSPSLLSMPTLVEDEGRLSSSLAKFSRRPPPALRASVCRCRHFCPHEEPLSVPRQGLSAAPLLLPLEYATRVGGLPSRCTPLEQEIEVLSQAEEGPRLLHPRPFPQPYLLRGRRLPVAKAPSPC